LEPVIIRKDTKVKDLLTFYMCKNTPDRQKFIIDQLRVEKDVVEDSNTLVDAGESEEQTV
jgi:topoisomerase-4 subunit B